MYIHLYIDIGRYTDTHLKYLCMYKSFTFPVTFHGYVICCGPVQRSVSEVEALRDTMNGNPEIGRKKIKKKVQVSAGMRCLIYPYMISYCIVPAKSLRDSDI